MKNLAQYLSLITILLLGCDNHTRSNPFAPAEKLAVFEQSALQDSLPQNLEISLSDLLGRELPDGQVSIGYFYAVADTAWQLNQYQGLSNAIKFYGPTFPGDFDGNGIVDYADFYKFANRFGRKAGQTGFDQLFDFDGDGQISWQDFWVFADFFESVADGAKIAAAKPLTLPDDPPESIGRMSHSDLLKAWPSLKRSAKTVTVERHYQFRIKSLDKSFADTTVQVTGEIFGNRHFAFLVNVAPKFSLAPGLKDSMIFGDTLRVVMSRFFKTDDTLQFSVESPLQPWVITWAIERDSVLVVTTASVGRDVITFRATDTSGQSQIYELGVEVRERPIIATHTFSVTGHSEIGYGEVVSITAVYSTYADSVKTDSTLVTPEEGNEISGLPLGKSELVFHFQGLIATLEVTVIDRPARFSMRFDGRGPGVRMDVADDMPLISKPQLVATNGDGATTKVDVSLEMIDPKNGYGYQTPSLPDPPTMSAVEWTLTGEFTDSAGQTSSATLQFTQAGRTEPPPPPPSNPPPSSGGGTTTPPPVTHTASEARLNNTAPGAALQLNSGAALNCSAPLSGTWSFGGQIITGSSASFTAANGTLSFTANGSTVTWNIQATPPGLDP